MLICANAGASPVESIIIANEIEIAAAQTLRLSALLNAIKVTEEEWTDCECPKCLAPGAIPGIPPSSLSLPLHYV